VLGSPPYADARTYGIGAQRKCHEWIDWMMAVTTEAVRVSRGLVLWVCAGVTRKHCYWPGPEGLLYEWWKAGGRCWRPAYWHRVGIPGSGGKQWLRADVEYVLSFTGCETYLPFADNTANGHPPKWAPGGEMSHRLTDGERVNQWGRPGGPRSGGNLSANGTLEPVARPSHVVSTKTQNPPGNNRRPNGERKAVLKGRATRGHKNGDTLQEDAYVPPVLANPGVAVEVEEAAEEILLRWIGSAEETPDFINGIRVGGGVMGHKCAHINEAPYPQKLAEWFIRGWCPPGGLVLDPFSGSGTTAAAAVAMGRRGIGCDLRLSQVELGARRCREIQPSLLG
jgi:hypothetical protein